MDVGSYRHNVALAWRELVATHADRPALVGAAYGGISYAELDRRANRCASALRDGGVARRDVVAIVHTKSVACYAAMLAALKLGAVYVNLDDQNPAARLRHIFAAARPKAVIGTPLPAAVRDVAREAQVRELDIEPDGFSTGAADEPSGADRISGADPAYIMFTSGSTGVPKGALMTHANVLNFGAWVGARFAVAPVDVFTNVNPMYFDNSVFDFYGALLNGAAVAPISRDLVTDAPALLAAVEDARCTVWFSVPSLLIYLTTMKALEPARLPSIRTFVFGGEGYPKPELRKLFDRFGSRSRLVNVYGPTECTCICSAYDVRAGDLTEPNGFVTLGPVAANFSMVVLDEQDRPVAPGETGELCLAGPQVGLGYVGDPERTSRSFVTNPANGRWNERVYRTGDLVRLGEDGRRLDFVGRRDNQIKHMGYRIELEEIEAALHQLDGVAEAAVLHIPGRREMKMLVAYLAPELDDDDERLRVRLAALLPPYMIPQRFERRAFLPKNANGKVDRRALMESAS